MNTTYILSQIDSAIAIINSAIKKYPHKSVSLGPDDPEEDQDVTAAITIALSAIRRTTHGETEYLRQANNLLSKFEINNSYLLRPILGVLQALRHDVSSGYTRTTGEIISGEIFSDFLDMAEHLLSQKYKDPAAVIAGAVLEEHLRKLCLKHNISINKPNGEAKKLDSMNSELVQASIYNTAQQKFITAFAGIRNDAAHGKFRAYTDEMVNGMLLGIRAFLATFSA